MSPKVSIIIPLYNKAPYVEKCLQTVASQSYKDWECIIVNDGSSDDSAELVERWLASGDSISQSLNLSISFRLISQPNAGVAAARNRGVAESKGKYIAFLDADDWWEPSFLEKMVCFAEQNPDAGLWASNYIYYKPGKTRVGVTNLFYVETTPSLPPSSSHSLTPSSSHLLAEQSPAASAALTNDSAHLEELCSSYINYPASYYQGTGMPVWTGATMMRRSVFDEMGGFPLGIRLGEDFLLWSKIALRYPIAFLDEPLAYYNNDVPASLRATRNLHAPEHNMLWHLDGIEQFIKGKEPSAIVQSTNHLPLAFVQDWRLLLDKLRVSGLQDYWLDKCYHDAAAEQLKKVDWTNQPRSVVKFYHSPLWLLRTKRRIRQVGSYCKQTLIKILHRK